MIPPYKFRKAAKLEDMGMTGQCPRCTFAGAFKTVTQRWDKTSFTLTMICLHCSGHVLVDGRFGAATPQGVFPSLHREFPFDFSLVHERIRPAMTEVYAALAAGALNLAGVGCRVVLERLVQGLGYRDGRGLEERLDELKATYPDLVAPLANAEVIRLVGNAAAHDAFRDLTRDQAEAAIEFTEDVLRAVYVAPASRTRIAKAFEKKP